MANTHADRPIATRTDLILLAIVTLYTGLAAFLQAAGPAHRPLTVLWPQVRPVFPIFALLAILAAALDQLRSGKSFTQVANWATLAKRCTRPSTLLRWCVACVMFWPFMDVFGWYKSRIWVGNPTLWDPAIVRLENVMHFGHQPWEWLQPVLGNVAATRSLDVFYHQIYPAVILFVVIGFALAGRGVSRSRYLVHFVLTWIIVGTVGGTLFPSVGPCYYGLAIPGPDPFAPLMAHLEAMNQVAPLAALRSQAFLWAGHTGVATPLGVSAMPSVHVGLAALVMAAAFECSRGVRTLGVLFWLATLVGSVALGWHYAADGYVATLIVVVLWAGAARFWRRAAFPPLAGKSLINSKTKT